MEMKFLILGSKGSPNKNVEHSIEELQNASFVFIARIRENNYDQARSTSIKALGLFDVIIGELLRNRDAMKAALRYDATAFEARMNEVAAQMLGPVSEGDQNAVATASLGNARLPDLGIVPTNISLEKLLNKLKHRLPEIMNFRIENGRHFLVFCADRPRSIIQLDVGNFCELCRQAVLACTTEN